jgi:hypothetical protein
MKKLALLCIIGAVSFTACQTDSETPAPNSKTQLLTAGPWHITSWTKTTGSGTPANLLTAMPACARDDRYTFGTNGVLTVTEGPTACAGSSPQAPAPWNFNSAQTVLTIGSSGMGASSIPYDVVQLTADVLQLRYTRSQSGTTVVDDITYLN